MTYTINATIDLADNKKLFYVQVNDSLVQVLKGTSDTTQDDIDAMVDAMLEGIAIQNANDQKAADALNPTEENP
jgi:hypothetical protein